MDITINHDQLMCGFESLNLFYCGEGYDLSTDDTCVKW